MSRVGEKIKEARLKMGMTQKALGKKLGVADKYINDIELGRKVALESFIDKAAKILQTDLNDISMVVTDEAVMEERAAFNESKTVKSKKPSETSEVWNEAFASILKNVPIYDYTLKNQKGLDRKSTRLNSSHITRSRMPSSA